MPDKAQEVLRVATHPKESVTGAIKTAKDTIIGSGSLVGEITDVGTAYKNAAKNAITTVPAAMLQLVKLHPIEAIKRTAEGFNGTIGDIIKIGTSPSRLTVAGTVGTAKIAKEASKLPLKAAAGVAKSPFFVWDALNRGTDKIFEHIKI